MDRFRRLSRRYPIKTKITTGSLLMLLTMLVIEWFVITFAFPNTVIGNLSVAGLTKNQIRQLLMQKYNDPVDIRIKERIYKLHYDDLGIVPDIERSLQIVFEDNYDWFPRNVIRLFLSVGIPRQFEAPLSYNDQYAAYTGTMVFDVSVMKDEIQYDPNEKQLIYVDNQKQYSIDPIHLKQLFTYGFGRSITYVPKLIEIKNSEKNTIDRMNAKINGIFERPLLFKLTDGGMSYDLVLTVAELRSMLTISYLPSEPVPYINVDVTSLTNILSSRQVFKKLMKNRQIPYMRFKADIVDALVERYNGKDVRMVTSPVNGGPVTLGNLAAKYIEVDIADQRMFTFENGNLIKSYKVSTGLYYPTPTGQFSILNKATNAYSDIYHVYMPYWMAFGYSKELNAYFGFHELPYWISDEDQQIHRQRVGAGVPSTGGCVALDIGAAKEVYEWATVGMPVYIFK